MATDPYDWQDNPVLAKTPSSLPTSRLVETRKPSAALRQAIMEVGLRYRPAAGDQLAGHQAKIAALIADLIDVPIEPLRMACTAWVRRSPYMPKASDLIALAQETVAPREAAMSAQAWCDARNVDIERNRNAHPDDHIEWYVGGTAKAPEVKLRHKSTAPDGPPYCTPEEARQILRDHPSSFARGMLAAIEARDA